MKRNLIESYDSNRELEERAEYLATDGLPIPADDALRTTWPNVTRLQYELVSISDTRDKITGLFKVTPVQQQVVDAIGKRRGKGDGGAT